MRSRHQTIAKETFERISRFAYQVKGIIINEGKINGIVGKVEVVLSKEIAAIRFNAEIDGVD